MKLSLVTRIFLGHAAVLTTFGAVSIFSVAEMHRNQEEIRMVSQGYLPLAQTLLAIETFHKNQEKDTERLVGEKSLETRRALIRLARLYFPPLMAERVAGGREKAQESLQFAPPFEATFVRELEGKFSDLARRFQEYEAASDTAFRTLEVEAPDEARVNQEMSVVKQLETKIGREISLLRKSLENRIRQRVEEAERRERRTGLTIIALSMLAIFVGLLATALSARSLRPVRTLIEGVSRISKGDYGAKLGVKGDDEISVLAREFDGMARALQEREALLKRQQEALLRAEQLAAVGRISAQIAHEVRNPLSSIGLNVELLGDALSNARFPASVERAEVDEILAAVTREVDRLTEITDEYLRMARLPKPSFAAEDLNEVLGSVLDFSRTELAAAQIEVVRQLHPATPRAQADEGQLRQVFLNLLRNSREAMEGGGGQLTVSSRPLDSEVEIVFSDTGKGMPEEVQERIFEPFFSTKEGGTGLGLAVARQIVQAHRGSISCQSSPGRGTTFVIRLPRA